MQQDKSERHPQTPDVPLDLEQAAGELLDKARESGPGRASRNLTPGEHAPLSQILVALTSGTQLSEHVTNGPGTLQVLRGAVTVTDDGNEMPVDGGCWATVPRSEHALTANEDSVVLITVAPLSG